MLAEPVEKLFYFFAASMEGCFGFVCEGPVFGNEAVKAAEYSHERDARVYPQLFETQSHLRADPVHNPLYTVR